MCNRMRVGMIMCFTTAATSTSVVVAAAAAAATAAAAPTTSTAAVAAAAAASKAFDNTHLQHPASSLILAAQAERDRQQELKQSRRYVRFLRNQEQQDFDQQQQTDQQQQQQQMQIQQQAEQQLRPLEKQQQQLQQQQQQQQSSQQQSFSQWWHDYWSRQPFPSGYTQSSITLLACLITTIIFLIVVGNLLVCIAIFTEKSLKPTQNWFIASLAVSDMLLGLVVMPFSLARELMGFWIFGPLWCDIHEAVDVLLTTASINTLCLISLDRYWSITQAVSYLKKRTPRRGAFMIAFVWIFSAAVSLPPLFGWKKQQLPIIAQLPSPAFSNNNNNNNQNSSLSSPSRSSDNNQLQFMQQQQQQPSELDISKERRKFFPSDELATPIMSSRRRAADIFPSSTSGDGARHQRQLHEDQTDGVNGIASLEGGAANDNDDGFPIDTAPSIMSAASDTSMMLVDEPVATGTNDSRLNGFSAAAPTVLSATSTDLTTEYPSCQLSDDVGYVLYSALGSFFIPCAVMVFTYIKIFLAARSRARRAINKQSRNQGVNKRMGARRAQTTMGQPQSGDGTVGGYGAGRHLGAASMGVSALTAQTDASETNALTSPTSQHQCQPGHNSPTWQSDEAAKSDLPALVKGGGKLVILERKKSIVAQSVLQPPIAIRPLSSVVGGQVGSQLTSCSAASMKSASSILYASDDPLANRPTYDCSELAAEEAAAAAAAAASVKCQHSAATFLSSTSEQVAAAVMQSCSDLSNNNNSSNNNNRKQFDAERETFLVQSNASCATLTTSGAKQASPSALNSSTSNDSSMITVMNASMSEVPVTRFTFKGTNATSMPMNSNNNHKRVTGTITTSAPECEHEKAAALLKAISEARAEEIDSQLLSDVFSDTSDEHVVGSASGRTKNTEKNSDGEGNVPDIVLERRATTAVLKLASNKTTEEGDHNNTGDSNNNNNNSAENTTDGSCMMRPPVRHATNETCFMTIEEDSDMFEAQAGRTIMMAAAAAAAAAAAVNKPTSHQQHASCKNSGGYIVVPPCGQHTNLSEQNSPTGCNNLMCRQRAARSGSSYCGSSMTINDDDDDDAVDDDLDECGLAVDDEPLTDECNGYSFSCTLDQFCPRAQSCRQCSECTFEQQQQHYHQATTNTNTACSADQQLSPARCQRHLSGSVCDSPLSKTQQPHHHHHHHNHNHNQQHHHHHHHHQQHQHTCPSENQSVNGEELEPDNVSHMTEYRSNDDLSSSIVGHDMLDATEFSPSRHRHMQSGERKKSFFLHSLDKNNNNKDTQQHSSNRPGAASSFGERKRSLIGFRLARLGSSTPLSGQSGGLVALAASQQQQAAAAAGGSGTRNLKALRQNFFLKLNQLTAKSSGAGSASTKQHDLKESKNSNNQTMSTQSSGTDHDASVDGATTSAVHSNDYPAETTGCEMDDAYEIQTSADSQANTSSNIVSKPPLESHADLNSVKSEIEQAKENKRLLEAKQFDKNRPQDGATSQATTHGNYKNIDDKTLLLSNNQITFNNSSNNNNNNNSKLTTINNNNNKRTSNSLMQVSTNGKCGAKFQDQSQLQVTPSVGGLSRTKKGHQTNHSMTVMSSSVGPSTGGSTATNRAYLASDNERHKRKLAKARERRATFILGLIMTCFICAWMPFFTFYVLRALCTVCREYFSPRFESFIFWMGYCNSAINPIIYTIFNRDFRKAFRKILFKCL